MKIIIHGQETVVNRYTHHQINAVCSKHSIAHLCYHNHMQHHHSSIVQGDTTSWELNLLPSSDDWLPAIVLSNTFVVLVISILGFLGFSPAVDTSAENETTHFSITLMKVIRKKTVLRNNSSRRLLYFIPRPLYVSAFTGHHQEVHII
jgi:hypothetical protein